MHSVPLRKQKYPAEEMKAMKLFTTCSTTNRKRKEKRYEQNWKRTWEMGDENMNEFLTHLKENNRKSVQMTLDVLNERRRLEACVSNLKD